MEKLVTAVVIIGAGIIISKFIKVKKKDWTYVEKWGK